LDTRHAVPAIYSYGSIVDAGGLIRYGSIFADAFRLVGVYAGRIRKGEKPADLSLTPVLQIDEAGGLNVRTNDPLGHRLTRPEER
jgi:putative ABC transport system substrate-binding protein